MKDYVLGSIASTTCGAMTGFLLGYFAGVTLPDSNGPALNVALLAAAFFAAVGMSVGAWLTYVKEENKNNAATFAMIGASSSALVIFALGWLMGVPAPDFSLASVILFLVPGALQGIAYQKAVALSSSK